MQVVVLRNLVEGHAGVAIAHCYCTWAFHATRTLVPISVRRKFRGGWVPVRDSTERRRRYARLESHGGRRDQFAPSHHPDANCGTSNQRRVEWAGNGAINASDSEGRHGRMIIEAVDPTPRRELKPCGVDWRNSKNDC